MGTLIVSVLVIGLLIIIHELGHYLFAKIKGIKVTHFSIGFGPKLLKKVINDTEFSLSLIPFGGYVRLKGEEFEEREFSQDEFYGRGPLTRLFVVFGGPLFNVVLGFLIFFGIFWLRGVQVIPTTQVFYSTENLGFQKGDKILELNGRKVRHWQDVIRNLHYNKKNKAVIERDGDVLYLEFHLKGEDSIIPLIMPKIGGVVKGMEAEKVGLEKGDVIIEVDSIEIETWENLVDVISKRAFDSVSLKVLRGLTGDTVDLKVFVKGIRTPGGEVVGRIGILMESVYERKGIIGALKLSVIKTVESIFITYWVIYKILRREISPQTVGGPIMIGKLVGEAMDFGIIQVLVLVALVSINLGVINLLPIPALDGGHILISIVEYTTRRKISPRVQMVIQQIGLVLLIFLIIIITFFDIKKLIER